MLSQMLNDDKSDVVRERVVKSLAQLSCFVEDPDKLPQVQPFRILLQILTQFQLTRFELIELFVKALLDSSDQVTKTVVNTE